VRDGASSIAHALPHLDVGHIIELWFVERS
jgi:hypothetical protein